MFNWVYIMLIYILIIVIIILLYYTKDTIIFIPKCQFRKVVMTNDYFNKLNQKDFQYREDGGFTSLEDKINYYKHAYANSFVEMNKSQRQQLYKLKDKIKILVSKNLNKKYHKINHIMYKIAMLNNNKKIEGGFPHTLSDVIVLRESFFHYSQQEQLEILAHELIHIYQKEYKTEHLALVEEMGFIPSSAPVNITPAANPDIDNQVYTYKSENQPLYIMNVYDKSREMNINDKSREMNFKSIGVYNNKIVEIDFSTDITQQGHPNEITAEILSRVICDNPNIREDWRSIVG